MKPPAFESAWLVSTPSSFTCNHHSSRVLVAYRALRIYWSGWLVVYRTLRGPRVRVWIVYRTLRLDVRICTSWLLGNFSISHIVLLVCKLCVQQQRFQLDLFEHKDHSSCQQLIFRMNSWGLSLGIFQGVNFLFAGKSFGWFFFYIHGLPRDVLARLPCLNECSVMVFVA